MPIPCVTLYDVDPNYLVMELIEGPTLAERIAKGSVSLDESLRVAVQIGAALEAAHEKDVLHRDLKPANIKIRPDGTVKVLDFGLAKLGAGPASSDENSPTLTAGATVAGVILGTAGYMSPEQVRGEPVDKRTDIWAFGVVLYEMLTGERLFEGKTASDTLASVLRDAPQWERVPPKARKLVRACVEREPSRRLRDIGDAWRLLDESDPIQTAAPPRSLRRALIWGLVGAFVSAVAAVGFVQLRRPSQNTDGPLRLQMELSNAQSNSQIEISPDGRNLLYSAPTSNGRICPLGSTDGFARFPHSV